MEVTRERVVWASLFRLLTSNMWKFDGWMCQEDHFE